MRKVVRVQDWHDRCVLDRAGVRSRVVPDIVDAFSKPWMTFISQEGRLATGGMREMSWGKRT